VGVGQKNRLRKRFQMSSKADVRLSPGQRLSRGLRYTAVGPVDVTRGTVGLSWQGAHSAANSVRQRLERSRLARELEDAQETISNEIAAAQEVLSHLPQAIADARRPKHRPRPWVLAVAGVGLIAVGAVTFSIVRRSMEPESSPRPPSVEPPQRP
jgi:Cell wall synthesis protein CwsA